MSVKNFRPELSKVLLVTSLMLSVCLPSTAADNQEISQPGAGLKRPLEIEKPKTSEKKRIKIERESLENSSEKLPEDGMDIIVPFEQNVPAAQSILPALHSKNEDKALLLLKNNPGLFKGDYISSDTHKGVTLAQYAAAHGNIRVIKYMLESDRALVYKESQHQTTIYDFAAQAGELEILKLLFNSLSSSLNEQYTRNLQVFYYAALGGQLHVLKFLTEKFPHLHSVKNPTENTALHSAATAGHKDVVEYLATTFPDLVNLKDEAEDTVLHIAAYGSHKDVVEYLATTFPDLVNLKNEAEDTVLHIAASQGRKDIVECLATNFPDLVNLKNESGDTALHVAANFRHKDVVESLATTFPDLVNLKNNSGDTVLHSAAKCGRKDIVEYLATTFPDLVNLKNNSGDTVLHIAAKYRYTDIVEYLATTFPDLVNERGRAGFTVLHIAAKYRYKDVVESLATNFPDLVNVKTDFKYTVLHVAAFHGRKDIVEYLATTFPGLVNERDKIGDTVLHTAAIWGQRDIVEYLVTNFPDLINFSTQDAATLFRRIAKDYQVDVANFIITRLSSFYENKVSSGLSDLHRLCHAHAERPHFTEGDREAFIKLYTLYPGNIFEKLTKTKSFFLPSTNSWLDLPVNSTPMEIARLLKKDKIEELLSQFAHIYLLLPSYERELPLSLDVPYSLATIDISIFKKCLRYISIDRNFANQKIIQLEHLKDAFKKTAQRKLYAAYLEQISHKNPVSFEEFKRKHHTEYTQIFVIMDKLAELQKVYTNYMVANLSTLCVESVKSQLMNFKLHEEGDQIRNMEAFALDWSAINPGSALNTESPRMFAEAIAQKVLSNKEQ